MPKIDNGVLPSISEMALTEVERQVSTNEPRAVFPKAQSYIRLNAAATALLEGVEVVQVYTLMKGKSLYIAFAPCKVGDRAARRVRRNQQKREDHRPDCQVSSREATEKGRDAMAALEKVGKWPRKWADIQQDSEGVLWVVI